jgi:hypothetical protein
MLSRGGRRRQEAERGGHVARFLAAQGGPGAATAGPRWSVIGRGLIGRAAGTSAAGAALPGGLEAGTGDRRAERARG